MAEVIKSGDSGNTLRVDSDGRALFKGVSATAEEDKAETGNSFILYHRCHLAAASSGALIAFTSAEPELQVHITRIYANAHTLTKNIVLKYIKNPTLTGGADITATSILNKNYSKGTALAGTLKASNASGDLTCTGGIEFHAPVIQSLGEHARDLRGTNVLGSGNTFCIGWETLDGSNAVDGEIIAVGINVYREIE